MVIQIHDPREIVNFSAGPAVLPYDVLKQVQDDIFNFKNTDCSILETSHRSPEFMALVKETDMLFREILNIPNNYRLLFAHGGASTQFANIAHNFSGKKAYLLTGDFSERAYSDSLKAENGEVYVVASGKDSNFSQIPSNKEVEDNIQQGTGYIHITDNNTLFGTTIYDVPQVEVPIIADMTSSILSRKIEVSKYALIYAGFQKNIGPSGTALVIIRDDLYDKLPGNLSSLYDYKTLFDAGSLYNTPSTLNIYVSNLVLKWLQKLGGLEVMEELSRARAGLLYKVIDESNGFYQNNVSKKDRSITNVVFRLEREEQEEKFLKMASEHKMVGLKGHKKVGGIRASIYIPMSYEHVEKLACFMEKFQKENG